MSLTEEMPNCMGAFGPTGLVSMFLPAGRSKDSGVPTVIMAP